MFPLLSSSLLDVFSTIHRCILSAHFFFPYSAEHAEPPHFPRARKGCWYHVKYGTRLEAGLLAYVMPAYLERGGWRRVTYEGKKGTAHATYAKRPLLQRSKGRGQSRRCSKRLPAPPHIRVLTVSPEGGGREESRSFVVVTCSKQYGSGKK